MGRLLVFWFSNLGVNGHLCLRVGWSLYYLWEPGICLIMWACQRSKKGTFTCISGPSCMLHLLRWDHSAPRACKRPSLFHHKPLCTKVLPVFPSYPWQKGLWLRKRKEEDPRRDRCFLRRPPDLRKIQNTSDLFCLCCAIMWKEAVFRFRKSPWEVNTETSEKWKVVWC